MARSKRAGKKKRKQVLEASENDTLDKPKRAKLDDIKPKTQGFLIGHNLQRSNEHQVSSEAISLLNEFTQKDPTKYKPNGEEIHFTQKSLQTINLMKRVFIESNVEDPHALVNDLFTDILSAQELKTRLCLRFQPVLVVTSECDEMVVSVKPLLKSLALQHENFKFRFSWYGDEAEKQKFCDEVRKYLTSLGDHEEVLPMSNPEVVVDVRLKDNICFISVLDNYNKNSKYNIANLVGKENHKDNDKDKLKPNAQTDAQQSKEEEIKFGVRGFLVGKIDNKASDNDVAEESIKILKSFSDGDNTFEKKNLKVDNLVFLSTDVEDISSLVHNIYTDLLIADEPKIQEVNFCRSILPVVTCKRKYKPIVSTVQKLITPIFVEQEEEETLKYKIACKGYFPEGISKTKIVEELSGFLTSKVPHKECGNPDVEILIQNIGQISYISILPNHNIFKGYNLAAIIESNKQVPEDEVESSEEEYSDDGMDEGDESMDDDGDDDDDDDSDDEDD